MIITDTGRRPVSIKFSRTTFEMILGTLGLLVVAMMVVLATYGNASESLDGADAAGGGSGATYSAYTAKVDQLEKNLATYRVMLKKMTELAGIDLSAVGLVIIGQPDAGQLSTASCCRMPASAQDAQRTSDSAAVIPVKGYISRSFRPEDENPLMRHYGVDLAVRVGTPVIATADGVVTFAGWDSTFGWKVLCQHARRIWKQCMDTTTRFWCKVGDVKKFGETIAISGSTGVSTAPHVHYEIRKGRCTDQSRRLS